MQAKLLRIIEVAIYLTEESNVKTDRKWYGRSYI